MIYFARTPTGSIKIGTTAAVDVRIDALRARYGCELEILATMPGGYDREAELHEQFAHLRLGRTEQFRPGPELMQFMGEAPAPPDWATVAAFEPGPNKARPTMLSLEGETLRRLDELCDRLARRIGGNPQRLRSQVIRSLIYAEHRRQAGAEAQADEQGSPSLDFFTGP